MATGTSRVRGAPGMTPAKVALALSAALLVLAAAAPAARAELVVFKNGKVVKVASHRDAEDRIEIHFPDGGSLTFDRSLVEGIEPDEVVGAVVQASQLPAPPAPPPPQLAVRVEAPRQAPNERVAAQTGSPPSPDAPRAPEEKRAPQHRARRHHR